MELDVLVDGFLYSYRVDLFGCIQLRDLLSHIGSGEIIPNM